MPKKKSSSSKSARKSVRLQAIKEKLKETYEEIQDSHGTSSQCDSANSTCDKGTSSTNSSLELKQAFESIKSMGLAPNAIESPSNGLEDEEVLRNYSSIGLENDDAMRTSELGFGHGGMVSSISASSPSRSYAQVLGAQGGMQEHDHEALKFSSVKEGNSSMHEVVKLGQAFTNGFSPLWKKESKEAGQEERETHAQVSFSSFGHTRIDNAKVTHPLSSLSGQQNCLNLGDFPPLTCTHGRPPLSHVDSQLNNANSSHLAADVAATSPRAATWHADMAPSFTPNEAHNLHSTLVQPSRGNNPRTLSYEQNLQSFTSRNVKYSRRNFMPTSCDPIIDWSDLFGANISEKLKLNAAPCEFIEGKKVVLAPSLDIFEDGLNHWKNCLVGQFLGSPPPFFLIKSMVEMHWKRFGKVEIKSCGNGLLLFKFEDDVACNGVLEQMWHVHHRPLLLRRWEPNMRFVNITSDRVPLWIKLRNVPLCLWSKKGLGYVATHIGNPLQMDVSTEARVNLEFARVCVEVNLEYDLPSKVDVQLMDGSFAEVLVEYAWKPSKCNHCKMVGHVEANCPKIPRKQDEPKKISIQEKHHKVENATQVWKVIQRKKEIPCTSPKVQTNASGSCSPTREAACSSHDSTKKSPKKGLKEDSKVRSKSVEMPTKIPNFNGFDALRAVFEEDFGEEHLDFDKELEEFMGGTTSCKKKTESPST